MAAAVEEPDVPLGMHVAKVFEKRRLARNGFPATIFDADDPQPTDAIYDVSTPPAVALAAKLSSQFKEALSADPPRNWSTEQAQWQTFVEADVRHREQLIDESLVGR